MMGKFWGKLMLVPRCSSAVTMASLLTLVVVTVMVRNTSGFTVGPPPTPTVCRTMFPQHHDYKPQPTESPYRVTVDRTQVTGGSNVLVTIATVDPATKFIGFYLQARDENDKPLPKFTPNTHTKVHNCFGVRGNAAHHANGAEKKENVTIVWTAPLNSQAEVVFTATIMRDFVTFWVFQESEPVQIINPMREILGVRSSEESSSATVVSQRPPTRVSSRRTSLNESLLNFVNSIGNLFTVRVDRRSAAENSRCAHHPSVFSRWFCGLFRNAT